MSRKGPPIKDFHKYLTTASSSHVGHEDYMKSPATAFLKYAVEAKSSIDLCIRKFPKNKSDSYHKDAHDSLQHLISAILPAIMGHFETFQRHLFAGMFDKTVYLNGFDLNNLVKTLEKDHSLNVGLSGLVSYRGEGLSSIGLIVADNLYGWHDPEKVNQFFNAFNLKRQMYSSSACKQLRTLWQLRHSIVHTGGTLTLPDAQKVKELSGHAGNKIAFEFQFIYEVARKLHPLVMKATENMRDPFLAKIKPELEPEALEGINGFFDVKSSISSWLR